MSSTTPHQLFLLADHLKLSLLERQRAISLNLEPHKQDGHISRSLATLQEGIEHLESQQSDLGQAEDASSDLSRLRRQYDDLHAQFHGAAPSSPESQRPNDPSLREDFEAAQSRPSQSRPSQSRRNKSVRFRDNPDDEAREDPVETANRAALFSDTERYRDEPEAPDQSQLDNQQIHTYHKQVLKDQDEQLDTLGQSIGRQRVLGIQMGNELDEQNELLEDVEAGVDRHTTTLDRARRRLGTVARKSRDNWNWLTIGILIVILVLLIVILN
jgi:syntaxin 8